MDDQSIIRRVLDGNSAAYALLVERYHRNLLAFIFRIVRDRHLAEDIGQEVFLDVYRELANFDPDRGTPFPAWLYIIARNRAIGELRRRGRSEQLSLEQFHQLAAGGTSAEEELIRNEEREALAASLAQIGEPFRSTILMSLQGATLSEIALRCGVGQATVKTRLFRARERIRQLLNGRFGGFGHEREI